jgi:hypothetical protein
MWERNCLTAGEVGVGDLMVVEAVVTAVVGTAGFLGGKPLFLRGLIHTGAGRGGVVHQEVLV